MTHFTAPAQPLTNGVVTLRLPSPAGDIDTVRGYIEQQLAAAAKAFITSLEGRYPRMGVSWTDVCPGRRGTVPVSYRN